MNKSFLKWAGNKYRVLPHILPHIDDPDVFIEPFLGSASVALNVRAESYVLNDYNETLISLYNSVLRHSEFFDECEQYFNLNTEESYYNLRKEFNQTKSPALFVYLNRHCFNGLTRYNKSGEFNVPYGKYKAPYFPQKEMKNFKEIFSYRNVQFFSGDFANSQLYTTITERTVVYFDPPYVPLTDTANFSDYTTGGFSYDDQIRLRDLAIELHKQGAKVIISNHDTDVSRELYSSARNIYSFNVGRFIAAKGTSRQPVKELLAVWNSTT
jgi:DNA adenine methylase